MRRSTSLVAAVALVAGVASVAAAQGGQAPAGQAPAGQPPMGPGGGPGMRGMGGGMQRMLFEGITLSAAQQAAVDSIQNVRREAMRARMQAGGAPSDPAARGAMMQEMRAAQEQDRQAMRALLSADQQKTFDANLARMQEMMRQRQQQGGGPGGPGGPGRGGRD